LSEYGASTSPDGGPLFVLRGGGDGMFNPMGTAAIPDHSTRRVPRRDES
jgi:hypothetical protein